MIDWYIIRPRANSAQLYNILPLHTFERIAAKVFLQRRRYSLLCRMTVYLA